MTFATSGAPIVVGVDGSNESLAAVRLAVAEAAWRRRPVRLVHAFVWPLLGVPLGPAPGAPTGGGLRADADRLVAEAADHASKVDPDVPITAEVVPGAPAPVLLHEAKAAELLVIGDRGLGGFTGLLVGSVAVQLVAHAACPVLVARGEPRPGGAVVVGVDGSTTSTAAVDFAMAAAERRGTGVLAVHAWTHPVAAGPGDLLPPVYDPVTVTEEALRVLAEALAGRAERYPDVPVRREVVHRRPAGALVDRSDGAAMLVVGARGRGGFAGLLLGSVSQAALHHARCPVAVVRRVGRSS